MFTKHFVRLITTEEISDEDIIEYFDIVQSMVPSRIVIGMDVENEEKASIDVMMYTSNQGGEAQYIYEIVLKEDIDHIEGDEIASELNKELEHIDFEFEASMEI